MDSKGMIWTSANIEVWVVRHQVPFIVLPSPSAVNVSASIFPMPFVDHVCETGSKKAHWSPGTASPAVS